MAVRSVLIIDDDERVAQAVARLFPSETSVEVLNDAAEALIRLLNGTIPELILCDVVMPEISGAEIVAQLRSYSPEAARRVVLMTGGGAPAEVRRQLEDFDGIILEKPFHIEELEAAVARMQR